MFKRVGDTKLRNNKLLVFICYTLFVVLATTMTMLSPLLTSISDYFSLSLAQSGTIFSSNFIGFVCFILIGGVLADRFGKKVVLSFSTVGFAISLIIFPLSPNYLFASILMALIGGFSGIIESSVSALINDLYPENSSFHLNRICVLFGIGALIGPISAGQFVSKGYGWKPCYFIFGGLSLIIAILLFLAKPLTQEKSDPITFLSFKTLFSDKKFLLICLCMLFYTGTEIGSWGWISTFLKRTMFFSEVKSSISVSVFWTAMVIGRLTCLPLIQRFKPYHIILFLATISIIVILYSGFVKSELEVWLAIVFMGLAFSSLWPLIAYYGSENYKSMSGTVFAILTGSGGLGGTIVPYLMGVVSEHFGMKIATSSPSLLMAMIVIIFIYLNTSNKNGRSENNPALSNSMNRPRER